MAPLIQKLAIIGQGLIGSSITRAVYETRSAGQVTVTDASSKVRRRVIELGIGQAKVVEPGGGAVRDADLVIICVPVGQIGKVTAQIAPHLKPGAIVSDVGSVKFPVVGEMLASLPKNVHLVPAHPLAGTEFSGPDSGTARLFVNRWCILTPPENCDAGAIATARSFWEALGSHVETMSPLRHDYVLSVTSHLPHLIAFSIFHTALKQEEESGSEVIKFSAGGFRDFTRIASSNPSMWRDIFLANKEPILTVLRQFIGDVETCAKAIEEGDGPMLESLISTSRLTRRKIIEKEHISLLPDKSEGKAGNRLSSPYATDD